jgi:VWFA-related protein
LTKNDFVLLDDGVPQTINAASFLDLEAESPVTRQPQGSVEPDVVNNAGSGRMWVLLMGPFGGRVAKRFVESALGPHDEVAVLSFFGTQNSSQAFTRSRQRMFAAIDRLSDDPPVLTLDPARAAFEVLAQVCNTLGRIGGRRKAVLLIDPPAIWTGPPPAFMAQRDALRSTTRNNVTLYVVSSMGLRPEFGGLTTMAALRALAEETGGDAIVNSNNYEGGYERFVRDTSAFYLLGYTPAVVHRDGEFHSITVRVNRPGLTVRARRGYYAPEPGATPPAAPRAGGPSVELQETLRLPLSANGISVDLFAAPFRDGRTGSVLLGAQLHGRDLALSPGESLEVGYQAMANDGMITPGAFKRFALDLSAASRGVAESDGLRLVDRMALAPGRHQVRFAVHQANGRTGMVVADVEVPDFSGAPVSLSGVLLASERLAVQRTLVNDDAIKRLLSSDPTAVRRFSQWDVLTAYAEVYTNARTRMQDVRVRVGVARAADMRSTREVASRIVASGPDRAGHLIQLNLVELGPGDHVLTLEARAGRRTANRKVPFSVNER